jgi:hypothetical protein
MMEAPCSLLSISGSARLPKPPVPSVLIGARIPPLAQRVLVDDDRLSALKQKNPHVPAARETALLHPPGAHDAQHAELAAMGELDGDRKAAARRNTGG